MVVILLVVIIQLPKVLALRMLWQLVINLVVICLTINIEMFYCLQSARLVNTACHD